LFQGRRPPGKPVPKEKFLEGETSGRGKTKDEGRSTRGKAKVQGDGRAEVVDEEEEEPKDNEIRDAGSPSVSGSGRPEQGVEFDLLGGLEPMDTDDV